MRAKAFAKPVPALGLAMELVVGIGLCFAIFADASSLPNGASAGAPAQQFVCHAALGDWCDLRDWGGIDRGHGYAPAQY